MLEVKVKTDTREEIPDFIPFVGFVDDTAVFGLVLKSFASELATYKEWKAQQ